MPPCRLSRIKLVAEAELPILPFLAPRVFQPWPFPRISSRSYSGVCFSRPQSSVCSSRPQNSVSCCLRNISPRLYSTTSSRSYRITSSGSHYNAINPTSTPTPHREKPIKRVSSKSRPKSRKRGADLGTSEQGTNTAFLDYLDFIIPERSDTTSLEESTTPERSDTTSLEESTTPERADTASLEQSNRITPERADTTSLEQSNRITPQRADTTSLEQSNRITPERADTASLEQSNRITPERADTAFLDDLNSITPERADPAFLDELNRTTPEGADNSTPAWIDILQSEPRVQEAFSSNSAKDDIPDDWYENFMGPEEDLQGPHMSFEFGNVKRLFNVWICGAKAHEEAEACDHHNSATKVSCFKCGAPRPSAAIMALSQNLDVNEYQRGFGPRVFFKDERLFNVWICGAQAHEKAETCDHRNSATKVSCSKCGAPRSGPAIMTLSPNLEVNEYQSAFSPYDSWLEGPVKYVQVGMPVWRAAQEGADVDTPGADRTELAYTIPECVLRFNRAFARTRQRIEARRSVSGVHPSPPSTRYTLAAQYADRILGRTKQGVIRQIKQEMNPSTIEKRFGKTWNDIWMWAALHLMKTSPEDLLVFLKVTHTPPYPPGDWVDSFLEYLAYSWTKHETPVRQAACDELIEVLCAVMPRTALRPLQLNGTTIWCLLPFCSKDQILKIFGSVQEHGVKIHWNTALHLATALARHDCSDRALDALILAAHSNADLQSPQYLSVCTTILRKAANEPDGLRVSLRMVQNLVGLGIGLNVQHCNVVMLNAVESGDFKSASNVYQSLVDNGLKADRYTFAILLKGAKATSQDPEVLNDIIRQAVGDLTISQEPVVALEILHNLYRHHFEKSPATAFATLAEAYAQLFDPESLIHMNILPVEYRKTGSTLMTPVLPAIGIMIMAFLKDRVQRRSNGATYIDEQLYSLYRYTRSLAERGVQPWSSMTETDYMANSFLLAFTANEATLGHAAEVIHDMQTPLPAIPDHQNFLMRAERPVCAPTVQSWSILLNGFSKHKKVGLAEQVMEYMRDKGMVPNQFTWNHLIEGYFFVGDHEGAIAAFKRMIAAGWMGSDYTSILMGRLGVNIDVLRQEEGKDKPISRESVEAQDGAMDAMREQEGKAEGKATEDVPAPDSLYEGASDSPMDVTEDDVAPRPSEGEEKHAPYSSVAPPEGDVVEMDVRHERG